MRSFSPSLGLALLPALALLALAGCKPAGDRFVVTDNFAKELISSEDDVADSYAVGSDLSFDVEETIALFGHVDMNGWTLVSSDPAVVELTDVHADSGSITAEGAAMGPGSAELMVVDATGATVHKVPVSVDVPDGVSLVSKLGTDAASGFVPTTPQKVCVGAYSAFEAQFSASGRSLASADLLGATASETMAVRVEDSSLWESREWLSVWPTLGGDEVITVLAGASAVEDVSFTGVESSEIAGLEVLGNASAVGVDSGDTVVVGAVGLDGEGDMVLGVTPTWLMPDGTQMVGDELSFTADAAAPPVDITVEFGAVSTTVTIAGRPTGASDSSDIGCSSVGATPAVGFTLAALSALALRRRARPVSG